MCYMRKTEDLKLGDIARLVDFGQTDIIYRRVLLSLGITCGTHIKVHRVAPLGCPILIEVLGVLIALRKNDARYLLWE